MKDTQKVYKTRESPSIEVIGPTRGANRRMGVTQRRKSFISSDKTDLFASLRL